MGLSGIHSFLLIVFLAKETVSFPYHATSPRSVPGRLMASEPDSIQNYIYNYLDMIQQQQQQQHQEQQQLQQQQQQQQQHRLSPIQYNLPEYEPVYQQGYISRRPQINQETLAAILPYLAESEGDDYSYDYNNAAFPNTYTDREGTWYDDAEGTDFGGASTDDRDKHNQEAALLQLFLDHLAGKYSLEDLETLERQAAIEDNTESELQSLMPRKKSAFPLLGSRRITAKSIIGYNDRRGQKEEALMVPAASARKPVLARSPKVVQKWHAESSEKLSNAPSSASPSTATSTEAKPSSPEVRKVSPKVGKQQPAPTKKSVKPIISTTMEPALKSAYEDFMAYLDQERYLRKTADEAKHSQQKRFVAEPQSLTQQLASLKKNVT